MFSEATGHLAVGSLVRFIAIPVLEGRMRLVFIFCIYPRMARAWPTLVIPRVLRELTAFSWGEFDMNNRVSVVAPFCDTVVANDEISSPLPRK